MSFYLFHLISSLSQPAPQPDLYEGFEKSIASMELMSGLKSYNPKLCDLVSNVPQNNMDKKCTHVIVGTLPGTTLFQFFMGSPYKSIFVFTGDVHVNNSQYEYTVNKVVIDKIEIPATGTCVNNPIAPTNITSCDVDGNGIDFSISYDSSNPKIVK